jgi:inosine-uridine nucleoside N-ribohydrolase
MNYERKYLKYKQKYVQAQTQTTKQIGGDPELVIIDTDPGIDDALAILLALGNPKLNVIALTTVFGNFPDVARLTENALKILNLANRKDIPVFEGETKPLSMKDADPAAVKTYIDTQTAVAQSVAVHGDDGLANLSGALNTGGKEKEKDSAAQAIVNLAKQYEGQITLITLGPLTNLALAVQLAITQGLELPKLLKKVIIMGGALFSPRGNLINTADANLGNAKPCAEANFVKDPDAAQFVLRDAKFSPDQLILIPLDLTTQTDYIEFGLTTSPDSVPLLEQGVIRNFIAGTHHYYKGIYIDKFERKKVAFHDSCAVFYAISPESFYESIPISVNVETTGMYTSGMSIIENRVNIRSFMESRFFKPVNVTFFQKINVSSLYINIIFSLNNLQRALHRNP